MIVAMSTHNSPVSLFKGLDQLQLLLLRRRRRRRRWWEAAREARVRYAEVSKRPVRERTTRRWPVRGAL